ncbi:hypothetical protein K435DRAFT_869011 [Dendrothele bispora CBS 962.96]|uniref:Uncharacterized protein n=1 Tax=Dendrothele bispora (strain CBS 962.96) TaxID=1314807 RepID=A0A4S8LAB4_DENBC|nr:hypothetical protein K435DRAFT_869011 [Dendrothele bispora CBS 962.96]
MATSHGLAVARYTGNRQQLKTMVASHFSEGHCYLNTDNVACRSVVDKIGALASVFRDDPKPKQFKERNPDEKPKLEDCVSFGLWGWWIISNKEVLAGADANTSLASTSVIDSNSDSGIILDSKSEAEAESTTDEFGLKLDIYQTSSGRR